MSLKVPAPGSDTDGVALRIPGAQLVACVAVLCDGPLDQKLKLCFEAFDTDGLGNISRAALIELLQVNAIWAVSRVEPTDEGTVAVAGIGTHDGVVV